MTPLIKEMVQLSPEPETATWFDLGQFENSPSMQVPAETLMRLPFDRTAIVGIDVTGQKFALWLLLSSDASSVTVGGCTSKGKYFTPFAYLQTPEGLRYYVNDKEIDQSEIRPAFRMVCAALLRIDECTECHQPTLPLNSLTNARRIAKGKPPLIYTWHTLKLEPKDRNSNPALGGTHATPRRHQCRGHWRNCKSGKKVWVKDCWRGDASKGTVFKDYKT